MQNKSIWRSTQTSLLTGVSYMVPLIIAAGVMLALCHIIAHFEHISITHIRILHVTASTPWLIRLMLALHEFAYYAFALLMPVIAGYVAYGFVGKPGLMPGLIVGMLVSNMHMGFLGAMLGGLLVALIVYVIRKFIILPRVWGAMVPTFIVPLFATFFACGLMKWVVGVPLEHFNLHMIYWIKQAHGFNSMWIAALLAGMIGFDLGGPINKVALTVALGLFAQGSLGGITAVFAAAMVAPIGQGLSVFVSRKYVPAVLMTNAETSLLTGLVGVTEGAIPFVVLNPWLIISNVLGSAVTGFCTVLFNVHLMAPAWGFLGWFLTDKPIFFILSQVWGILVVVLFSQFIFRVPVWFERRA